MYDWSMSVASASLPALLSAKDIFKRVSPEWPGFSDVEDDEDSK